MREIKFRAKAKESIYRLKIKKGKWIYGCSLSQYESGNIEINGFYCDPDTLCQYTGLKDKNGKEIYEGDILRHENHDWEYPVICIGGCFQLDADDENLGVPLYQFVPEVYMEVVGNVWAGTKIFLDEPVEEQKPVNTLKMYDPVMVSDDGKEWYIALYKNGFSVYFEMNDYGSYHVKYKFIVPLAVFDFNDLKSNIKRSVV